MEMGAPLGMVTDREICRAAIGKVHSVMANW